ncbi:hypothetical protein ABZX40_03485 [Streptomyces sp. NPDC004610]|uniref:hypothetical protein n=1 Tax=unclassified Streptomyces TaxID=2593676 RepID=UPI00339DB730
MSLARSDHSRRTGARRVPAADARTLLGGVLAGDASAHPVLHSLMERQLSLTTDRLLSETRRS